MSQLVRFLQYHNAVPIALSLLTVSFGAAFAASEEVRESIYARETRTIAVDNTYIAQKDLDSYLPRAEIIGVTEDDSSYFVQYNLSTIDVVDAVWQDVVRTETMRVSKDILGDSIDLGLYVTKQLNKLVSYELARLRETQRIERRAVPPRVVATEYSGLVGKFLDPTIEELSGYVPVVVPRSAEGEDSSGVSSDATTLVVTVLGDNPTRIPRDSEYRDLGVAVAGAYEPVTILAFVNDGPERAVGSIVLDTSLDRTWHIRYEVRDARGQTAFVERDVIVGDVPPPEVPPQTTQTTVEVPTSESTTTETGFTIDTTTETTLPAEELFASTTSPQP